MKIVTYSLRLARRQIRPEVAGRYRRLTHRRHRRAVKMWLKSGRPVRNFNRPLAEWYVD